MRDKINFPVASCAFFITENVVIYLGNVQGISETKWKSRNINWKKNLYVQITFNVTVAFYSSRRQIKRFLQAGIISKLSQNGS